MISSRYAGHTRLCLSQMAGGGSIAIRIIRASVRNYKVEILESVAPFRKGQVTNVPKGAVKFMRLEG